MRTLLPSRLLRSTHPAKASPVTLAVTTTSARCDPSACLRNSRSFAHINEPATRLNHSIWFTSTAPRPSSIGSSDHKPPDPRTLQLGKTVRILHERLPTLLQSPLPGEILSPQISLHLFPSTHPYLPTVSGRIAYIAALWTAPVAWGRVPLVGNVKLTILSERMVRNGRCGGLGSGASRDEKLIVKWKTCGKTTHRDGTGGVYSSSGASSLAHRDPVDKIKDFISGTKQHDNHARPRSPAGDGDEEQEQEFTGLFVFDFDERGRIVKHVIEHTEEGGHWDGVKRVVSVTDWLLGRFNGNKQKGEQMPELALCEERPNGRRSRLE